MINSTSGRRPGITLLELALAFVATAIVVTFTLPHLDFGSLRVEAESRTVMKALLGAQRSAVHRQYDVVVAFDTVNGVLRVHHDANSDGDMGGDESVSRVRLSGVSFGRGPAPLHAIGETGVTFERMQGGLPAVTFHRDGRASETGGFYLHLASDETRVGHVQVFHVERSTGRATRYFFSAGEWTRGE